MGPMVSLFRHREDEGGELLNTGMSHCNQRYSEGGPASSLTRIGLQVGVDGGDSVGPDDPATRKGNDWVVDVSR